MQPPSIETFQHALARTRAASLVAIALLLTAATQAEDRAPNPPPPTLDPVLAASIWTLAQLIPSPLLVAGTDGLGGGVRWQITPLVFSFGVVEDPVRAFVVAPVARQSGAVELYVSPEWVCCAPHARSSWLARAGSRVYWPLVGRGDGLAASIGGSYYLASDRHGGAVEVGIYTFSTIFGITLTVSPTLVGREVIIAFTLHLY